MITFQHFLAFVTLISIPSCGFQQSTPPGYAIGPSGSLIDVRDIPAGTTVIDPINGQRFQVPNVSTANYGGSGRSLTGNIFTPSSRNGIGSNPYSPDSLSNPYGAGSPYKADGLMNPYSQYGSRYSNNSWTNPYATNAPKIYSADGTYRGRLSTNKYDPDSISNPYGKYGNKYSSDSLNNPYGAGNPYSGTQHYVVPQP
jgi:hypothetical protein